MVSAISRFVVLWVLSAGFIAESESEHHPLCRTLGSEGRHQPSHFPSTYICLGDDADAVCSLRKVKAPHNEESGAVAWLVYEGRRRHVLGPTADDSGEEWVHCTDHYARNSPQPEADEQYGASPERGYSQIRKTVSTTVGDSNEQGPDAEGNAQKTKIWQELRNSPRDDDRSLASVERINGRNRSLAVGDIQANRQMDSLVYAPNSTCDSLWLRWPAMQERAIAAGTVLIFDVYTSVGNLFITFGIMMQFARLMGLGLILRWTKFPGFREALNPGEINWDLDADPFMELMGDPNRGANATGLHYMKFRDFAMVLSNSQLGLLALTLDINETSTKALATHFQEELPNRFILFMGKVMQKPLLEILALRTQPCTWNMLLRRSPSMMASLDQHSPWGMGSDASGDPPQSAEYIAWHIRTADGETATSYKPAVHRYVIQEPSSDVCPTYIRAMEDALHITEICHPSLPSHVAEVSVYISSNSKPMATDCTLEAARHDVVTGLVDLGLNASDAHTGHSRHPLETALGAFLDFFFLIDSTVIVRTGSSFSGTVVRIKGLECTKKRHPSGGGRCFLVFRSVLELCGEAFVIRDGVSFRVEAGAVLVDPLLASSRADGNAARCTRCGACMPLTQTDKASRPLPCLVCNGDPQKRTKCLRIEDDEGGMEKSKNSCLMYLYQDGSSCLALPAPTTSEHPWNGCQKTSDEVKLVDSSSDDTDAFVSCHQCFYI